MMEKLSIGVMGRIALWCVCVGMCVLMAAMTVASLFVIKEGLVGACEFLAAILGIWCVFAYFARSGFLASSSREILAIAVFCFAVHLILIGLLPSLAQNGVAAAWDSRAALQALQSGKICFTHNVRNQYWCNYEILLSVLGILFKPKLAVGQILNAVCCVAVLVPTFKLSERIGGRGIARFATLMLGLSPAVMFYSTLLTSEYLAAVLLFYGLYLLLEALGRQHSRDVVLPSLLCGGFVGMSYLFKPVTIFFMCAMLVVMLIEFMRSSSRRGLLRMGLIFVLVFGANVVVQKVGQKAFANVVGDKSLVVAGDASNPFLYEFVLGMNVETDGIYSSELAMKFIQMNEGQRRKFAMDVFKRDYRKYPLLMVRKFKNLHGSHLCPGGAVSSFTLSFRDWPLVPRGRNYTPMWMYRVTDYATLLSRFVFLLGAFGLFFVRKRSFAVCAPGLLSAVIILGFAVVEQFIEGHGRYKTAIYPFYFMMVPYISFWFERDNPAYVRIVKWATNLRQKLKGVS